MSEHSKLGQKTTAEVAPVTGPEAAPIGDDGVDTFNSTHVLVAFHNPVGLTAFTVQLWLKVGVHWCKANNASFTGLTGEWCERFEIAGANRVFAQVVTLDGASSSRLYTTTRR